MHYSHLLIALTLCCALAQSRVLIGRTVSTLGTSARDSEQVALGYDFWLQDVKTRGGVFMAGMDGQLHDIVDIKLEDASQEQIVDVQYQELIVNRGVHMLIGPFGGGLAGIAARRANATQTPMVTAAGLSGLILAARYRHYFSVHQRYGLRVDACISLLNRTSDIKTFITIRSEEAFEAFATGDFISDAALYGLQEIKSFVFPTNASNYDSVVDFYANASNVRPDMIFIAGVPDIVVGLIPKIRNLYDPKLIFVSNGGSLRSLVDKLDWEGEYVMDAAQWAVTLNYTDQYYGSPLGFKAAFENRTGKQLEIFHAAGYISGYIVQKALEVTRSLSSSDIQAALRSLNVPSLWGNLSFGPQNFITAPAVCQQIIQRRIRVVAPQELTNDTLVYPGFPPRPPPPPISATGFLIIKIVVPVGFGLLLFAFIFVLVQYIRHKYNILYSPKSGANDEWGSAETNKEVDKKRSWLSRMLN
jgi:branched-chain amino acid transport system substrate-binding protein